MTTNVGADSISRRSMGFTQQDHHSDNQIAIQRTFSPEFRNRLDAIVNFAPLPPEVIGDVVDKFITELHDQLLDKNIILSVDDEVRLHLATKGYDRLMGARPMARTIQELLKKPLSKLILFGDLKQGKEGVKVAATMKDGAINFETIDTKLTGKIKPN